jgi:hypothetical protein
MRKIHRREFIRDRFAAVRLNRPTSGSGRPPDSLMSRCCCPAKMSSSSPEQSRSGHSSAGSTHGAEVFSAYLPNPRGPLFMQLIERTFGKNVTTRTWDTVRKVAAALERLP